jgi:hypothetical protein
VLVDLAEQVVDVAELVVNCAVPPPDGDKYTFGNIAVRYGSYRIV